MKHHREPGEKPATPRLHRAALKTVFENATPDQKRDAASERLARADKWADYAKPKFADAAQLGLLSQALWEPLYPRLQNLSFLTKDENDLVRAATRAGRRGHEIKADAQFFRHCADSLQSDAAWLNRSAAWQEKTATVKNLFRPDIESAQGWRRIGRGIGSLFEAMAEHDVSYAYVNKNGAAETAELSGAAQQAGASHAPQGWKDIGRGVAEILHLK